MGLVENSVDLDGSEVASFDATSLDAKLECCYARDAENVNDGSGLLAADGDGSS
jgi:hypothetical protein